MTATSLEAVLDRLDTALAARPIQYHPLMDAFRSLTIPNGVTDAQLSRVLAVCCHVLDGDANPMDRGLTFEQGNHLTSCALDQAMRILRDPDAHTRAWIAMMQDRFRAREEAVPEDLNADRLPPPFEVPWDRATAEERLKPFLRHIETILADKPAAHFRIGWDVARGGRDVFRPIITEWLRGLDRHGIGMAGTADAIERALDLAARAEAAGTSPANWAHVDREIMPLLTHPHPMIAAGAARYLGALFADETFRAAASTPSIVDLVEQLRTLERHRAAVAGAFVCGFDWGAEGLNALASDDDLTAAGFDLDGWILDIFANGEEPPYLPNAQALWFYVHEHYCTDPGFAMKLIDIGRGWVALMCATELHEPVDGMRAVLERLVAEGSDQDWVRIARRHLTDVYGVTAH
jgi:hypothetical protein